MTRLSLFSVTFYFFSFETFNHVREQTLAFTYKYNGANIAYSHLTILHTAPRTIVWLLIWLQFLKKRLKILRHENPQIFTATKHGLILDWHSVTSKVEFLQSNISIILFLWRYLIVASKRETVTLIWMHANLFTQSLFIECHFNGMTNQFI